MPNLFDEALAAEGVTGKLAALSRSIYSQESGGGRNTTTSNAGARGGMQIIPSTFASVADKGWSIDDPLQNARAGIRYLKQLDKQAGGDPALTAAGYYGGPGGMEKARRGVAVSDPRNPKAPDTLQYGAQVVARMGGEKVAPVPAVVPAPVLLAQAPQAPVIEEAAPVVQAMAAPPPPLMQPAVGNPWQDFLRSMPETRQPVNVNDLRFGEGPPTMAMHVPQFQFNAGAPKSLRPNFDSFGSWGTRRA